jgi:uncharacterized OB-fold protein
MMSQGELKALLRAIEKNGDKGMSRFFDGLKEKTLLVNRCHSCNTLYFPPQTYCPDCLTEDVTMVKHPGEGRVYAFTSMPGSSSKDQPVTLAMVELDGVEGRIFARVEAPFEEMAVGMEVEINYFDLDGIIMPGFRPVSKESE